MTISTTLIQYKGIKAIFKLGKTINRKLSITRSKPLVAFLSFMISCCSLSFAQSLENMFPYGVAFSQIQPGNTARFQGMGGANTAVGGDLSALGGNPAGLGLLTKSQVSISPAFINSQASTTYLGSSSIQAVKNKLYFSQLGIGFYNPLTREENRNRGIISLNFGVSYNKTNDFTSNISYNGVNSRSSIADYYARRANFNPGDSLAQYALAGYLINPNQVKYYLSLVSANPFQQQQLARSGSQSELTFAGALNLSNKLYIGASINFLGLGYYSDNTFTETGHTTFVDSNINADYVNNYYQSYDLEGSGINLRVGLIYRPTDNLRLGASIQTPSWYSIDETCIENFDVQLFKNDTPSAPVSMPAMISPISYNLKTPATYTVGAAVLDQAIGLLSADLSLIDYTSAKFSTDDPDPYNQKMFSIANSNLSASLKSAINLRIGGEFKVTPSLMARCGYTLLGNPYKSTYASSNAHIYTGGLGYQFKKINLDLAYQRMTYKSFISPYTPDPTTNAPNPFACSKNAKNNIVLTISAHL